MTLAIPVDVETECGYEGRSFARIRRCAKNRNAVTAADGISDSSGVFRSCFVGPFLVGSRYVTIGRASGGHGCL
jgi:hypothetical protein